MTARPNKPRLNCCYCGCRMSQARRAMPTRDSDRTRDHIRPRAWKGDDDPTNFRICCSRCNLLRSQCGHCIGAMACVRAVSRKAGISTRSVIRGWGLGFRHFQSIAAFGGADA